MQIGSQTATAFKIGAQDVDRVYVGATLIFGAPPGPPTETVATTGGAGEIIFDPIAPVDAWTATSGGAGEIILEAA